MMYWILRKLSIILVFFYILIFKTSSYMVKNRKCCLYSNKLQHGTTTYSNVRISEIPLRSLAEDKKVESESVGILLRELTAPQKVDKYAILWMLAGQGLVLNVGFLVAVISGLDLKNLFNFSFDSNSMIMAMLLTMILSVGGLFIDLIPWEPIRRISIDTKVFSLRILGRSTSPTAAAATSLLLSAAAGFSEELAFRGVLFTIIQTYAGTIPAYAISSILFGLGHSPVFGSSVVLETFFGVFFAWAYVASNYNLAVPVAIHTLYDFIVLFVFWWLESHELNQKILEVREGRLLRMDNADTERYLTLCKAVFDRIDFDGDGYIEPNELELGLRLFGYVFLDYDYDDHNQCDRFGPHPFGKPMEGGKELFDKLDVDKDGKLSMQEFSVLMQQGLFGWPEKTKFEFPMPTKVEK